MVMMKSMVKSGATPGNHRTLPSSSGSTDNISANIKVVVRVRPPNEKERQINCRNVIDIVDDKMLEFDPKEDAKPFFYQGVQQQTKNFLKRPNKQLKFMFDSVFGPSHSNEDVFCATTKTTISSLMEGFNCSVFVYGATGAGKTFTMIGNKNQPGITYLTMDHLFKVIESFKNERDFDICVSYLEVYNENVFDLLLTKKTPLQLREDAKFGVVVAGLTINSINTAKELLDMLEKGNKNRTQHPTDANAESSRSHAVFQVYVKMRYKTSGSVRMVKLSMIDLAGSERASATGCIGDRFKEGANINRSLLSLANCINKLADGCKYIPYRDSKLTRLLKDSLGGNCETIMIANISPSSLTYEDTYNTLKYASRANNIQLSIKKNVVDCNTHVAEYVQIIEELRKEVKDLKAKLAIANKIQIVTKKEPDPTPVKNHGPEWRNKIQTEFTTLCGLEKKLLQLVSQQKVLVMRQRLKQKSREQLSYLCDDTDDEQLEEVCQKDLPRQEQAIEHFSRQISIIQNKLQSLSKRRNLSHNRFVTLCLQAKLECPDLSDFIEKLKLSLEINLIKARDDHKTKLLEMQRQEMTSSAGFLKDMPNMLKKLYLILKGYGKITPGLSEEYADIMRKAKSSRAVTWEDESNCLDENHFKFMVNLDFEVPDHTPKFSIKTEDQVTTPTHIIVDSDSDVENKFTLKRRATPKAKSCDSSPVVLDDSSFLEDDNLDGTKVISPAKKPHLSSFKKIDFEIEKDFKPLDPDDLNSTFVLAAKLEGQKKLAAKNEPRQVLKERGNVRMPEKNLQKAPLCKLSAPVGKAFPLRRPVTQQSSVSLTPQTQNGHRVAFGSSTTRSTVNFTKPRDKQVMRGRERVATHPYSRPHTAPSSAVAPQSAARAPLKATSERR